MIFEIPFDEEITRKQTNLKFQLLWKKSLKNRKTNLFISIGFFLFGCIVIYGNGNVGYVFVVVGIFGIYMFYSLTLAYHRSKKKYIAVVESEIEKYKLSRENSIWEFDNEYFCYKDYKYNTKIKWDGFVSFKIIDDNLFLDLADNSPLSYILAKEEVGDESFQNVIDFLESKLKRTSH